MMHNWKIRNYVLFGDITEDYTAREPASHIVLRNRFKDVREEPEYIGIFPGKNRNKCVVKQQKITVNATHTHTKVVFELTSQVNDFSAFLCMESHKSLSCNYCFDMHFNCLEPVLSLSSFWNPLRMLTRGTAVADDLMQGIIGCLPEWQATFFVSWNGRQRCSSTQVHAIVKTHGTSCLVFLYWVLWNNMMK